MRPGIRETIYQISYWLLPRNKMETVWETGQEAGHPLTWDKIISFCPRFPSRIKRSIADLGGLSIKEPGRVIPEAVGVAPSAGQRRL